MNSFEWKLANITLLKRGNVSDLLSMMVIRASRDVDDIEISGHGRAKMSINPDFADKHCDTAEKLYMCVVSEMYRFRMCYKKRNNTGIRHAKRRLPGLHCLCRSKRSIRPDSKRIRIDNSSPTTGRSGASLFSFAASRSCICRNNSGHGDGKYVALPRAPRRCRAMCTSVSSARSLRYFFSRVKQIIEVKHVLAQIISITVTRFVYNIRGA